MHSITIEFTCFLPVDVLNIHISSEKMNVIGVWRLYYGRDQIA